MAMKLPEQSNAPYKKVGDAEDPGFYRGDALPASSGESRSLLHRPFEAVTALFSFVAFVMLLVASGVPWIYLTINEPGFSATVTCSAFRVCTTDSISGTTCNSDASNWQDGEHTLFTRGCGAMSLVLGVLGAILAFFSTLRLVQPTSRASVLATRARLTAGAGFLAAAALATCWAASVESGKFTGVAQTMFKVQNIPGSNFTVVASPAIVLVGLACFLLSLATASAFNLPRDSPEEPTVDEYVTVYEAAAAPPPRRAAPRRTEPPPPISEREPLQQQQQQQQRPPHRDAGPPVFRQAYAPPQAPKPTFMSGTVASLSAGTTVALPEFGGKAPANQLSAVLRRLGPAVAAAKGDLASEVDMLHLLSRVLSVLDSIAPELSDAELATTALDFMRLTFDDMGVDATKSASWMAKCAQKVRA
jgi:hypothetical protein